MKPFRLLFISTAVVCIFGVCGAFEAPTNTKNSPSSIPPPKKANSYQKKIVTNEQPSVANTDKTIILVADQWLPYNGVSKGNPPGYMIEVAQYAFEKHGYTVDYQNVPWPRAILGTREGVYAGIIGAGFAETPDFIFPNTELGVAKHSFFVNKDSTWTYNGLSSLDNISLGVIRDYSYGTLDIDYVQKHKDDVKRVQILHGDAALEKNIKKLQANRIDALIEDVSVFNYQLLATNIENTFKQVGVYAEEKLYIAFSPKEANAKFYADILTQGMNELRKSGQLNTILKKYGMSDWR